ncbi:C39 family peptidase [Nitrospira sp. Nam74]
MKAVRTVLLLLAIGMCPACGAFTGQPGEWASSDEPVRRHTLKELRDLHVIKQEKDFSCGAAALATLMIYYYGEQTSEQEILTMLMSPLTEQEKARKAERGFSLLDLKRVALEKGFQAAGFRLTMSQLARVTAPILIFVEPFGYKHFAVLRGIDRGRVYVADPMRGNLRMAIGRFLDEWHGIVFVLGKPGEEEVKDYPLKVPHPEYIQPELARFNSYIDLGMMTRTLPFR